MVFNMLNCELDAENFYIAVYTKNREYSHEAYNKFIELMEEKRWDTDRDYVHIPVLNYPLQFTKQMKYIAARAYVYTATDFNTAVMDVYTAYRRRLCPALQKFNEDMIILRQFVNPRNELLLADMPLIWKIETKLRLQRCRLLINTMETLLSEPSLVETELRNCGGTVTCESFPTYLDLLKDQEPEVWWGSNDQN